ncbi:MAG: 16S rRNA (uracil(1498)-N(3))-methyltransferase [Lachnospiraceae bacterium]|nr:16S rRNA (uracil(1498)-N(3))-methyltransferase [uncultured Acetatifactor sp.]MCI8542029.1 16S rRNA (uracil(1498)-N(3))-methyltransferase [Lachnospiraceae bacterium]
MYQFFVDPAQIYVSDKRVIITGEDVNHIKNVLRMRAGEEISVSNGLDGREYRCGILSLGEEEILCELRFMKEDRVELPSQVYLFQGLPKADKMELIIQKAVELGVRQVIPVAASRCVVKLDDKKAAAKRARWQGIARAAAKQSKRAIIPEVTEVSSFSNAVREASMMDVALIPYELAEDMSRTKEIMENLKPGTSVAVFIGPEGGFSEGEISLAAENGIRPITLGKRILRTETAGLAVLSWIMYQLES